VMGSRVIMVEFSSSVSKGFLKLLFIQTL
jgi:hypothetical protein